MKRLLVLLGLVLAGELGAETFYYVSDAGAFPVSLLAEAVAPGEANAPEYLLVVERTPAMETRKLYRKSEEIERRVREGRPGTGEGIRERLYRKGILAEEAHYDDEGYLLEEGFYEDREGKPQLKERRRYRYEKNLLRSVEAEDAGGTIIGRLEYRYDAEGTLSELRSSGSFGEGENGLILDGSAPRGAWVAFSEPEEILRVERFDGEGRRLSLEIKKKGATQTREDYSYGKGGSILSLSVEDREAGTRSETSYDGLGRGILVVERRGDTEISRTERVYDDEGRLTLEKVQRSRAREERRFSYDDQGRLDKEEFWSQGGLNKIAFYAEDSLLREEYYSAGQLVVRVTYSEGRKVLEEFIEAGEVLRKRTYP